MRRETGFMITGGPAMMVLVILREGPRHGYDISRELKQLSKDKLTFQQGTLYPILSRLGKEGLVEGQWDISNENRARRIFSLTDKGRAEVEKRLEEWDEYVQAVADVVRGTGG